MSSFTSISVNKNKKIFAPKVGRRNKKPAPSKSSQESKSIESSAKIESTQSAVDSTQSTITATQSTFDSTQATFVEPSSSSQIPMVVDAKEETLTQEELAVNTRRKRRHAAEAESSNKRADIGSPVVPRAESAAIQLKEEAMTPHFEDAFNDDYDDDKDFVEPKDEEIPRNKDLLKKNKGKKPASQKKKTAKKSKSKAAAASSSASTSKGTAISIGIGIPGPSTSETQEEESSSTQQDGQSRRKKDAPKKRHKFAYRLVENMKTLDDITNDPANADSLEKPMSHFTKDIDGIVSKAFKEMEEAREAENKKKEAKKTMSAEELEELRKKEEEEERAAAEKKRIEKEREEERRKEAENHVLQESSNAVQVRIVNGEIVLDTDTLVVERQAGGTEEDAGSLEVVEETNLTRKVNSNTYGKRKKSARWDVFETATFYEYLSQFGTDFEMISKVMPGRTRNQIRLKFNREEKANPDKITEYLITKKKPMDLEKFKEIANIDLEVVPDDFHELQLA